MMAVIESREGRPGGLEATHPEVARDARNVRYRNVTYLELPDGACDRRNSRLDAPGPLSFPSLSHSLPLLFPRRPRLSHR